MSCGQSDLGHCLLQRLPSALVAEAPASPVLRRGKPNSGTGVDKSLPVAWGNARKAASHCAARPERQWGSISSALDSVVLCAMTPRRGDRPRRGRCPSGPSSASSPGTFSSANGTDCLAELWPREHYEQYSQLIRSQHRSHRREASTVRIEDSTAAGDARSCDCPRREVHAPQGPFRVDTGTE